MRQEMVSKQNSGFTLIELIVSMLVSSVVILSAVLFLSVCLTNYRDTAAETELMMEAQIAVNLIREVVMEATEPVETGECDDGAYYYIAVRTRGGLDGSDVSGVSYYHLFIHDTKGKRLLYHKEASDGPVSAVGWIHTYLAANGMVDKSELKQYFLADYVLDMELNTDNVQLPGLSMQFECSGRVYYTTETIRIRNALPDTGI